MGQNVADLMWGMLESTGVKRCYGIVGDALNPVLDALLRNGNIDFVDTSAFEEVNPYKLFDTAALYTGRLISSEQVGQTQIVAVRRVI